MSDEPTPKENGADWKMPEPIFRSSEGHTPKRPPARTDQDEVDTESPDVYYADEVDTLSPDFFEADTEIPNVREPVAEEQDISELPTETPDLDEQISAEEPREETSPDAPTDPSIKSETSGGGCLKSMVTIVGVIGLFAAAIVIALVYFLFYFRAADSGTF